MSITSDRLASFIEGHLHGSDKGYPCQEHIELAEAILDNFDVLTDREPIRTEGQEPK